MDWKSCNSEVEKVPEVTSWALQEGIGLSLAWTAGSPHFKQHKFSGLEKIKHPSKALL